MTTFSKICKKKYNRKCAKEVAAQYHLQPWNLKLRSSFAASLDLNISAEKMRMPNEEGKEELIEKLRGIQKKYLYDLLEEQTEDRHKVWNSAGLARIAADPDSVEAKYCDQLLKRVDDQYHLPLLATLGKQLFQIL